MAISTSSQTMDAPGLLTRIKKRSSAFLQLKPTQPCWPDAEDSTGSFYDTVDGEKYWNLKNQNCSAFLEFVHLSKKLASILKKHTEAPIVLARWKAYMIGESAPLCALGILFCCGDTEYLKTAASHISASGAVDESSGVIIRYRSTPPRYKGKLIHLGLGRQEVEFYKTGTRGDGSTSRPMEPHVYHIPSAGNQSTDYSHSSTIEALGYSPQCFTASEAILPGDSVYVEMVDGIRTATIGGRIEYGDQELFVTAAHPFTLQRLEANAKEANAKERLPAGLKDAGYLYYSSCFNGRPELDYAIIQPGEEVSMFGGPALQSSDSMFALPIFTSEEDFKNLVETTVRTNSASSGVMVGELDTIPEFLDTLGATELQEVYAASFESDLAPGDSGSWVYNAECNILHGHIVAGVPEDKIALIVPAYQVFADLTKSFAPVPKQKIVEASVSKEEEKARSKYPPVNSTEQYPPCNTLSVGNLPVDTSEDELITLFSRQLGYKRLCFRTKQNGPMCFVEFEDISFATKALNELDGYMLHDSFKDGIKLSFSKNPLGVRKTQQFQAESVNVNRRKDFEIETSQRGAQPRALSNSRDPSFPFMETSVASSPESISQRFESNVQHSQQASRGISHPGNDILSRPAFWYHSDEYVTPDAETDATNENILAGLPTWQQLLQQSPPNGVASQYRLDRAETSFDADIENILAGLPTSQHPLQQIPPNRVTYEQLDISLDASSMQETDPEWQNYNNFVSARRLPTLPSTISDSSTPTVDSSEPTALYCNVPGCGETLHGNHGSSRLYHYLCRKHSRSLGDYLCAEPSCGRTFNRSDTRLKHYRSHHPWLANGPLVPRRPTFAPQTEPQSSTVSDQISGRADARNLLAAVSSITMTSDHQNLRQPRMTDSSREQFHSTKSEPSGYKDEYEDRSARLPFGPGC